MPEDSVPFFSERGTGRVRLYGAAICFGFAGIAKGLWHSVSGEHHPLSIGGCDGPADTPDPIPNSEVKRPGGENTLRGKIAAAAFSVFHLRPFGETFFVFLRFSIYKIGFGFLRMSSLYL